MTTIRCPSEFDNGELLRLPALSLLLSFVGLVALGCASALPEIPPDATKLRSDVYVELLAPGIWRHVSYRKFPTGYIPSNGLVVTTPDGALIVDTAWTIPQTAAVLDWTEANVGLVRAVVVTHAHSDRLGGLGELAKRAIPSYALAGTVELAAAAGWPPIEESVASGFSLEQLGIAGELFYPGAGHTIDNAIVWLEASRILVGGCLVRSAAAATMGNTKEGDLESWPLAIALLQARYPHARLVIPGHGEPGGGELLAHTRELLAE